MSFTSLNFIIFVFAVVLIYYLLPKKAQWVFLLVASYAFYLINGFKTVFYIIITTLSTYFAGVFINSVREKSAADLSETPDNTDLIKKAAAKKIKSIQTLTIVFNLGILAVLKYLNFLGSNINSLLGVCGVNFSIPHISLLVPLGLSFYTFQSLGYVIDIGRGKYKPEKNPAKFALFVSFFPSIVQGPISRFDQIGEQLTAPRNFDYDNFKFGIQLALWGFFKKLVIADRLSILVTEVFGNYENFRGIEVIIAIFCYAMQIYTDFSGGVDISRGVAQMLGIELPVNFERPYFSKNMTEYWRRWHITLGSWMRDYVFYPIMLSKSFAKIGKKAKKAFGRETGRVIPSALTSFVVFFLIGIWHGATWQYVCFALYNAVFISLGMLCKPLFKKLIAFFKINTECFSWKLWQIVRTFILFAFAKTLVRAPSLYAGLVMIKRSIFNIHLHLTSERLFAMGLNTLNIGVSVMGLLVLFVVSLLQENGIKIREKLSEQNLLFRWAVYIIFLAIIIIFGIYGPSSSASDFIYKRY